jgi:hypothetical protein
MSEAVRLRDIDDVQAYVRKVAGTVTTDVDTDFVQEGIRIVYEKERELSPGASLRDAIGGRVSERGGSWLRCRLLNIVKGSSAVTVEGPSKQEEEADELKSVEADALSNVALRIFESREQVRDPRVVARYLNEAGLYQGASHRPPGSAAAVEIWAAMEAERWRY